MGIDLEVAGRHALLFDDDGAAAFVNSGDALVDWNSLLIDRYDVRHLLSSPPPPRKRRLHSPPDGSSTETDLDRERYLDLQAAIEEEELDVDGKSVDLGGFHSVAFSYGNTVDSNDKKNSNDGMGDSGFHPPFPVPESLLQCLPSTEKVHQIMARTALFVSKNGGQSEIVLRVKQGDNPTFGFLMPGHHLHPYFRYLVDHQDLLKSDMVGKSEIEEHSKNTSGALSLLGSVYGSGDDEEAASDNGSESKPNESREIVAASVSSVEPGSQKTVIVAKANEKDEATFKHASSKNENIQVLKKNSLMIVSKAGIPNSKKKEPESALPSATVNKPSCPASVNASTIKTVIVEPPSDVRKLVDKVVEFILKNGPQFEAVLTEQDSKQGRFPFLLPSNQFNSYYVNVLRKAQESKLSGKRFLSEKDDQMMSRLEKKSSVDKESASLSLGSARGDIPYDCDRKEKFKMVLGKSKKDGDEPPSRADAPPYGNTIDAAQTAAILQAATRGVKNTHFVPNISLNGDIQNGAEAEVHMTKEQKLKAERLKRAKMFVSMLKNGAAPSKSEISDSLSMEPQPPLVSGKERSIALDVETSVRKDESERKLSDGEIQERLLRRKYRSRPSRNEDDEEKDEFEDEGEQGKNEKYIRKKHKSRRSSRENDKDIEEDEVREDYRRNKRKHRSHRSSSEKGIEEVDDDEEYRDHRHGQRKHRSRHYSRDIEEEQEEDEVSEDYRHNKRKHRSHRSSSEKGIEEVDDDEEYRAHRHGQRKHRSRHYSCDIEEEHEEDEVSEDYRHNKRKHRSHRSSSEKSIVEVDDEKDKDHRHGQRKHSSHHYSRDIEEEQEDEKDRHHRHGKRKHRTHRSSCEHDIEEDEEDRNYRHGKRKHRSHRSSRKDETEEDDDGRDHKKSRKKHRSHHSSDEGDEEDYEEKHSKKKHRSRLSSRKDKHKYRERYSSTKNESSDDENHSSSSSERGKNISQSAEDLEEGEIISKITDRSRGSAGGDASREASIDVASSHTDSRAPSQPLEPSEVPEDLRAKIRAMLMANI